MDKKKLIITGAASLLGIAILAGGTAIALDKLPSTRQMDAGVGPIASPTNSAFAGVAGTEGSDTYLSQDEAKAIALQDAGLAEDQVSLLRIRLEYDDGRAEYDVEFLHGTDEYDYSIDAVTGKILSVDRDAEEYVGTTNTSSGSSSNANTDQMISEEAARKAALTHAKVSEEDAVRLLTQLDKDDGRWIYEVEFYSGNTEYDYEVDAYTGDVLSYDHDAEYRAPSSGSESGTKLTAAQAKAIALEHAGIAESDAQYLQIGLDEDDGRLEYEVEWNVGRTEYSCKVDAYSGTILEFEKDLDD